MSPWAALGKRAWPAGAKLTAKVVCSRTGRPALLANTGVVLKVEQVIPKNAHRFRNPYGDGKFRVKRFKVLRQIDRREALEISRECLSIPKEKEKEVIPNEHRTQQGH